MDFRDRIIYRGGGGLVSFFYLLSSFSLWDRHEHSIYKNDMRKYVLMHQESISFL